MRALQISAYGDPLNVLELVDIREPGVPGTGEVLIDVKLAPLNLHDPLFMRSYFRGPPATTVVGNDGFGRVTAVGSGVTNVKVGDHVLAPNLSLTWRERLIAPAQGLFPPMSKIKEGVTHLLKGGKILIDIEGTFNA